MKRANPWSDQVDLISSDDSDSEVQACDGPEIEAIMKSINDKIKKQSEQKLWDDNILRKAAMYQDYMSKIPVPVKRGSVIPCNSWVGLGKSIKELYGQPLHYLTNILLKQWDKARLDTEDGRQPLDSIIHPAKAEANVWLIEEVHRRTTSYNHLATLWRQDGMYSASVDPIFPVLPLESA
ncbi:hypothetical protein V2J09_011455 [Rumex salicifolius]